ncbi:twin-arginine translocase subunit TatC [Goodfellowiella coeruleoviolacea]|uniref:Sec-independent protein translocase protein TatC n=1 Tax=Goodfellowiella coeruleoviolacea TaxID=334858 RepID=A0AAE3KIW2_9PSEU|nr:twin-arginine translocase subunit TatC [Goodfellowiella coeruleoviolacea]MCP2163688.1 sec-independent protein translocase protein TatC [Goodfellowiella coeruleoviolacea]
MTLIEHIYELRNRLGVALLAVLAGGVLGFLWFQYRVWGLPSLSDLLTEPYCALPSDMRVKFDGECRLLQTAPFEAFLIQMKVGIGVGAVLTSPIWLYQIWAFITPGLYAKERKFAASFVLCAVVLFVAGAVLAYFVAPQGLLVLSSFGGDAFVTALAGSSYVNFILGLLLVFGVSFELPLLVVMLNLVGVLPYEKLRQWRRGIIFALFIFAAVATPGTDPISMVAMAVALTILFELAIQIARINDRRKARRRAAEGWDNLSDDEAAPFDYTPEPVEPAEPIAADGQQRVKYDDAT